MPYTVTKYPQGTFSWTDIASTDIVKTKAFLTELFGWTAEDMPTGIPNMDYTMFYLDGKVVAGGSAQSPDMKGLPSLWSNYITVDNIEEMAAKVEKLGGKIIMPVMKVLDAGKMAGIQDPTGATVFLWEAKRHIGAEIVNTVGAMCWNELYTRDLAKAQEFYGNLFGWTFQADETGYVMISNNGRINGGMMAINEHMGDFPPCWMVYFTVKNIEAATTKIKELGGQVYMTKEVGVGTIGMVTDPTGAAFMVLEMNVTPDEWKE